MARKKKDKAKVHKDLDGLDVSINEFGEVVINKRQDELNKFLDKNVDDKKLSKRNKKEADENE